MLVRATKVQYRRSMLHDVLRSIALQIRRADVSPVCFYGYGYGTTVYYVSCFSLTLALSFVSHHRFLNHFIIPLFFRNHKTGNKH
jgi:hypothetical protein